MRDELPSAPPRGSEPVYIPALPFLHSSFLRLRERFWFRAPQGGPSWKLAMFFLVVVFVLWLPAASFLPAAPLPDVSV